MIYYVRHGESVDNKNNILTGRNNVSLSKKGKKQAVILAEKLKDIDFDICFSSPLKRAKKTAKIILKKHKKVSIIYDKRLIERNYGHLSGVKINDLKDNIIDYKNRYKIGYEFKNKNIESVEEIEVRIKSFLNYIKSNYSDKNILIVAHGGIGRIVTCIFEGYPKNNDLSTIKNINNADYKIFDFK